MKEEMVDSEVEWIGKIPRGWSVGRLKEVLKENKRKQPNSTVLSLSYGNVIKKNFDNKKGVTPENFDSYQGVLVGDVVLRLTDLQNDQKSLRVGLAKINGIITSAYLSLSGKNMYPDFSGYLLHDLGDIQKIFYSLGGGVRQSMKFADLAEIIVALPPLAEQKAIAEFLDRETALIDKRLSLIGKKRELLKELRKSVVHEAVTKGLDKDAEMVDSGVEWIGKIPKGWMLCRLQTLVDGIKTGKEDVSFSDDDGSFIFYTCGVENLKCNKAVFYGPAILMAGNGDISNIKIQNSTQRFNAYQRVYILKAKRKEELNFVFWLLKAGFSEYVRTLLKGSVIEFIKLGNITHFPVAVPPLAEQKAIADFLERETLRIDKMLSILDRQEALLKEQRKALVHEVVTGKRRVI